jgi:hypothetical protein
MHETNLIDPSGFRSLLFPLRLLSPKGCMSCKQSYNNDDNNGNNDDDGNGVLEVCEDLYEQAAKCEKNVKNTNYQDTSGCELIHSIIPQLNSAFKRITGSPPLSKIFAWGFGIACGFMGIYIYLLHKKVIRQKVNLSSFGFGGDVQAPEPAGVAA